MGASSGPPPPRCAGLGCSSVQEGHCGAAARPCPAIRHFIPGRPLSTGDKRLPWPRTLVCSVPARGSAASQHEGLQPQVKLHLHTLRATEPRSAHQAALAPAGAQKETTPFPRAVLQPQPRHRGLLGPRWEHGAPLCPAPGERALSTPATEYHCSGRKGLEHWGDLPSCVS